MNQEEKFIQIIQAQQGVLYKVASLYAPTREDREDLVQEMVYQLWKSFDSFEGRSQVSTWIYRVALNVAIHALRQRQRTIRAIPLLEKIELVDTSTASPDEERWQKLQAAMEQLSLLERGILMLHLERKSYQEIAEVVGLSVSNIGTRLNRIRAKLKKNVHQNSTSWSH